MEMAERLFQRLSAQQKDELEALLGVLLLDWADFKSCRLCEEGREKDVSSIINPIKSFFG